eukprot:292509-Hanusia_phi.AAC.1
MLEYLDEEGEDCSEAVDGEHSLGKPAGNERRLVATGVGDEDDENSKTNLIERGHDKVVGPQQRRPLPIPQEWVCHHICPVQDKARPIESNCNLKERVGDGYLARVARE